MGFIVLLLSIFVGIVSSLIGFCGNSCLPLILGCGKRCLNSFQLLEGIVTFLICGLCGWLPALHVVGVYPWFPALFAVYAICCLAREAFLSSHWFVRFTTSFSVDTRNVWLLVLFMMFEIDCFACCVWDWLLLLVLVYGYNCFPAKFILRYCPANSKRGWDQALSILAGHWSRANFFKWIVKEHHRANS